MFIHIMLYNPHTEKHKEKIRNEFENRYTQEEQEEILRMMKEVHKLNQVNYSKSDDEEVMSKEEKEMGDENIAYIENKIVNIES
jgi:predicted naringenin-chalcone synthase